MASIKESVEYTVGMKNDSYVKGANANAKATSGMEKSILGGKTAILGITGALAGATAGIFKMADMASDLDEAMNVINSTMGDSADSIIAWSETSIQAMGISQTQALKTAGVYGSMATSMGLTEAQGADMAKTLTQLSADLASFFNVSQEVAANSLKGVFTGETESLKQFGIMIDTTTLAQYGYNQNMSQSEKIMVRYKAVMDQTKNIQGDFARTSDGLANQTRILTEQFKQFVTVLGGKVGPAVTGVVNSLNDGLAVAIAFASGETEGLTASQLALLNTLSTIGSIVGSVVNTGFVILGTTLRGIFGIVSGLLPLIQLLGGVLLKVGQIIGTVLNPVLALLDSAFTRIGGAVATISEVIVSTFGPIIAKVIILMQQLFNALAPVIFALENALIPIINILTSVITGLIAVITPLIDILVTVFGPILVVLANIISTVLVVAINLLTTVLNILSPIIEFISQLAQKLAQIIQGSLALAFTYLEGPVVVINNIFRGFSDIVNTLGMAIGKLASAIIDKLKKAFDIVLIPIEAVSNALETLIGWVSSALDAVSSFFSGISEGLSHIPLIGRFFDGESATINGSGQQQTVNNYNFTVNPSDIGSYRQAYRSGRAMVGSNGGTL